MANPPLAAPPPHCCSCLFPYPPGQETPQIDATFNGVANSACCATCFTNGYTYFNYYTTRPNGPCWCVNVDHSYPYLDSLGNYISTRSIFGMGELMPPARCPAWPALALAGCGWRGKGE